MHTQTPVSHVSVSALYLSTTREGNLPVLNTYSWMTLNIVTENTAMTQISRQYNPPHVPK